VQKTRVAKLFKNGGSQAVRLPAGCRFSDDTVYLTRDEVTGDVVLSSRPGAKAWEAFFELVHSIEDVPDDFMSDRPMNIAPQERNLFEDEENSHASHA
jgi:antitoxin VapB